MMQFSKDFRVLFVISQQRAHRVCVTWDKVVTRGESIRLSFLNHGNAVTLPPPFGVYVTINE